MDICPNSPVARGHEGEGLLPVLLVLHVGQEVDDLLEEVGQGPPLVLGNQVWSLPSFKVSRQLVTNDFKSRQFPCS